MSRRAWGGELRGRYTDGFPVNSGVYSSYGTFAAPGGGTYSYDAVPYSVAVAWFFLTAAAPNRYIFGALWIFPYFADMPNYYGYGVSVLVPAALAVYGIRQILVARQAPAIRAS